MKDIKKQRKIIFKLIRDIFDNMSSASSKEVRKMYRDEVKGVIYAAAMCDIITANAQMNLYKLTRMKYRECKEGGNT